MPHTPSEMLASSVRIALAALLHDLGKFSERARLFDDPAHRSALDAHLTQYCPFNEEIGRHTHIHAAYTGMTFDLLESSRDRQGKPVWPDMIGKHENSFPFTSRQTQSSVSHRANSDDSLISASAMHHKPDTFLQWIIATADRVASSFERESFESYNREEGEQVNHYTARLWSLLEQVQQPNQHATRYPLNAYSPSAIMPTASDANDKKQAQQEYAQLWQSFMLGLQQIPASHRHHLDLWLDHFDTLWLTFTHAIPSGSFKSKVDVSLYDHSKTVAALATALWRYYAEQENYDNAEQQAAWAKALKTRSQFGDKQFLLIQGDFAGIQDFLFANGGEATKNAAKLLRGRSFYVSLLCELAALKTLEALSLPSTSQIINAAGKFLIVAPATANTTRNLEKVEAELNKWFLTNSFGEAAIVLAVRETSCNDLMEGHFQQLMQDLFSQIDEAKLKRFNLTNLNAEKTVFSNALHQYHTGQGVCAISGKQPAEVNYSGMMVSRLSKDQMLCGKHLANPKRQRILITNQFLDDVKNDDQLSLEMFGYYVTFTDEQGEWLDNGKLTGTGKFGDLARAGIIKRFWDISLASDAHSSLWHGYARRNINAYVPIWQDDDLLSADVGKYNKLSKEDQPDKIDVQQRLLKTFHHIACENRILLSDDRWQGQTAIITLKGDIDNLGAIFQTGITHPSFAKMASLSRQVNAFFAIYLPWLCKEHFPNTYTVFAGGDDFFLIGPWHSTILLADRMQQDFAIFCSQNSHLHFSTGMVMTKPSVPISTLAMQAEEALESAKTIDKHKNAVTLWQQTVKWTQFNKLLKASQLLDELYHDHQISMSYRYGLLHLAEKAGSKLPEDAIWRSHLAYRTERYVIDKLRDNPQQAQLIRSKITQLIYGGLNEHKLAFKIALFTHLYQFRD